MLAPPVKGDDDKGQLWAPEAVWMKGDPSKVVVHFSGLNASRSPEAVAAAQRDLRKRLPGPTLVTLLWDRHPSLNSGCDDLARVLDTPVPGIAIAPRARVAMVGRGRGVTQIKADAVLFPGRRISWRARLGAEGPEPFRKTTSVEVPAFEDVAVGEFPDPPFAAETVLVDSRHVHQGWFTVLDSPAPVREVVMKTKGEAEVRLPWWKTPVTVTGHPRGRIVTTTNVNRLTMTFGRGGALLLLDGQRLNILAGALTDVPVALQALYGLEEKVNHVTLERVDGTWVFLESVAPDLRRLLGSAPPGRRGPRALGARPPFPKGTPGEAVDRALTGGIVGLEEMLREQIPADKNRRLTIYTLLRCREAGRGSSFSRADLRRLWEKTGGDADKVYQKSLDVMIASALIRLGDGGPDLRKRLQRDVDWIVGKAKKSKNRLTWAYPAGRGDLSNTQFALLAVDAAIGTGIDVGKGFWPRVLETYAALREADPGETGPAATGDARARRTTLATVGWPAKVVPTGKVPARGWGYDATRPNSRTLSMTASGIGAVALALHHGHGELSVDQRKRAHEMIRQGWSALGREYDAGKNAGGPQRWLSYGLYATERAGAFTGITALGGVDWYVAGAGFLVKSRREKGWYLEYSPEVDTSFAVLFLLRASKPLDVLKTGVGRYRVE